MYDDGRPSTAGYLRHIGVEPLQARTSPFDPGYDAYTLLGHLEQSAHLMSVLKVSMACWLVANERVSRRKVAYARDHHVATVCGGGPFEIAAVQGRLPEYLDLCADMGFTRIEAGQGFTDIDLVPEQIIAMAASRGLEVQFELGGKHDGPFTADTVRALLDWGRRWLDAGAVELIVEARESAAGVGLFDATGGFDSGLADQFLDAFGFSRVCFEAPTKPSQFAMLNHFGAEVRLCNVRLEELLRVEIYRRGLHSDAFGQPALRPPKPREIPAPARPESVSAATVLESQS